MDELLKPLAEWLNAQPLHSAIAGTSWAVPATQTVHIICVAVVMGAALIVALRGLELAGKDWSLRRWSERFRGSTFAALWVLLATGIIMTIAEPERELMNWVFRTKMLLVVLTIILAYAMNRSLRATRADRPAGPGVRIVAVIVLLLWMAIATCGRWIAYAG